MERKTANYSWQYKPEQINFWYTQVQNHNQTGPFNKLVFLDSQAVKQGIAEYFNDMHMYAFRGLKQVVRDAAYTDLGSLQFTEEFFVRNITILEEEFAKTHDFEYLGIEPEDVIHYVARGQVKWYQKNFNPSFYEAK